MIDDYDYVHEQTMAVYNVNNVSFLDLPKMANGKAKWQIWQWVLWVIFDLRIEFLVKF